MNYNETLLTPTGLEQWQPHIYGLDILRDDKGHIVMKFAEMGVTIINYVLTRGVISKSGVWRSGYVPL